MQRECLYDPRIRTDVIRYYDPERSVLWSRCDDQVRILYCRRAPDVFDDLYGMEMPVFTLPQIDHADVLYPAREGEACVLFFGPNVEREDDDPVGIVFKLKFLLHWPKLGETVKEYIRAAVRLRDDPRVIEKAMTPQVMERFGDIEIIPSRPAVVHMK